MYKSVALVIVIGLLTVEAAAAEDKQWEFGIAPYLWSSGLDGTVGVGVVSTDVEADFKDIIANLDRAVMLRGFADRKNWGLYFDYLYMRLKPDEVEIPLGSAGVRVTQNLADFGARFGVTPALDVLVGLRYLDLDTRLDLTVLSQSTRLRTSEDWIDPYLGLKYTWRFSERWSLALRGDIGGFKIFDGADLAWLAGVTVNHRPSERWGWGFGYRYYDVDYDQGSGLDRFEYDVSMSGLTIGIGLYF